MLWWVKWLSRVWGYIPSLTTSLSQILCLCLSTFWRKGYCHLTRDCLKRKFSLKYHASLCKWSVFMAKVKLKIVAYKYGLIQFTSKFVNSCVIKKLMSSSFPILNVSQLIIYLSSSSYYFSSSSLPWYNLHGWLSIKNQLSVYLPLLLLCTCVTSSRTVQY